MAAAAVTGIQVGAAIVATRYVIGQTDPASLALLRYAIGLCCLLPLALTAGRWRIEPRDLLPVALLGIVQFGVLIILLNYAVQFISSAQTAMIFAIFPLLTMIIAASLGRESLTVRKGAGVLVTILGVGVTLGGELIRSSGSTGVWIGASAVFAAALCGAVCSVFYQPYLRKYPALPIGAFAMLASVVFLSALAAGEGFFAHWPRFTGGGWAAVILIGVSSGGAFFLWLWALANISPTRVTVFLALGPVTAAILGAVFLGEELSTLTLIGLVCVVFGLWLALRSADRAILKPG
ncbi:MAG: DMT family transporter [Alphaproteobacteria bacterium]